MLFLKILYFGPFQISLNESLLRSPISYSAFLSKQHGITFPSQVITGLNQSLAHLSGKVFLMTNSPSAILYLLNFPFDGVQDSISALSMTCIDFKRSEAFTFFAKSLIS